ncbi:hypothetical protein FJT64_012947 [Amphibalanus amphitrite]|uniref:Uncharacterized protein n=1 Tax=Amphibalanus amphitrite TaxID=1232801 RepID=A0A6A4UXY7_AMPAM|nr:hypothetical protein FJT64_012947 [Amphibalanus amphitrite]
MITGQRPLSPARPAPPQPFRASVRARPPPCRPGRFPAGRARPLQLPPSVAPSSAESDSGAPAPAPAQSGTFRERPPAARRPPRSERPPPAEGASRGRWSRRRRANAAIPLSGLGIWRILPGPRCSRRWGEGSHPRRRHRRLPHSLSPAPASRAPPLLRTRSFRAHAEPRRVVAPPADSVHSWHLVLDESSDASDDQEPPPVGPEDALSRGEEPPRHWRRSEPQQETWERGGCGPARRGHRPVIQEVVAASMAGCGDSPGSSRPMTSKGLRVGPADCPLAGGGAADALAAELGQLWPTTGYPRLIFSSDPDPDLEWLQRHAPVGGSGDHSAAETDDQVSDTASGVGRGAAARRG